MEEVRMLNDRSRKITSEHLNDAIQKAGNENVIFELFEGTESRLYIIQDRGISKRYNPHYKIYLISSDLSHLEDFYVGDLVSAINTGQVKVHYRYDLLYSGNSKKQERVSPEYLKSVKTALFGIK